MPEISIQTPEDIKKLESCYIHSAELKINEGTGAYLELEISHITMPKRVRVRIYPVFFVQGGFASLFHKVGVGVLTSDIAEDGKAKEG